VSTESFRISYVIPTRNRPEMFERALLSLINQTHACFEVVVSDNSDEENARINFEIYSRHRTNFVKYFRPATTLSMTAHWDWAIRHATGDYVGILTDRMFLKPMAISTLTETIQKIRPRLLVYFHDVLEDEFLPFLLKRTASTGMTLTIPSRAVIEAARKGRVSRMWPRMLNSLCHKSVLNDMRFLYGEVFTGIAPDYSFCFRALDHLENFTCLDERILISSGKHRSNGGNFIRGAATEETADFIKLGKRSIEQISIGGLLPWTSPVPHNIEVIEYERARSIQRSGLYRDLCRPSFYHSAMRRISHLKSMGVDTRVHERDIEAFRIANKIGWINKLVHDVGLDKVGFFLRLRLNRILGKRLPKKFTAYTKHDSVSEALSYDSENPFRIEGRNAFDLIVSEFT
jgi:glycosyltransferase involved in cell wall biosynthesis